MQLISKWWAEQTDASRVWIATLSLSIAALLVGWLVLGPMFLNAQALNARKNQLALEVGALDAFAGESEAHEKERRQLLADSASWRVKLPEQVKAAEVLRQLDTLALQAGLRLTSVKPQAGRTNGSLTEVPFEVSASGDFFAARRFLQQLETQSAPAMKVVGVALSAEQSGALKQVYIVASPGLAPLAKNVQGSAATSGKPQF